MTELGHSMQSCEMPENDFVYLAKEVDELLEEKDKHIAELEKYLQKVQADRINDIAKERKRWAREDLKALAIRDLRQQAKGLTDYAKSQISGLWPKAAAERLINQANALEQDDD